MRRASIILAAVILGGCTVEPVKPWERDLLARPEMQLVNDPVEASLDEHIHFSKEGAFGGQGAGGGGCGCN